LAYQVLWSWAGQAFSEAFAADLGEIHQSWQVSLVGPQELQIFEHEPFLEEYFLLAIQVAAELGLVYWSYQGSSLPGQAP